jgi:DNA repair photolyase
LEIGIVSKSQLVLRDIDVLQAIGKLNSVVVNITVTTTDVELARKLEPRAPRPDLRLDTVRRLNEAGVFTGVICAPVMPGVTDHPKMLESVVAGAKRAGAKFIFANPLFLKSGSEQMFTAFLEKEAPHLATRYRERLKENGYASQAYRKRISTMMEVFCKKHGMPTRDERKKIRDVIERDVEAKAPQMAFRF